MAHVITDAGRDWLGTRAVDSSDAEFLNTIAVGIGDKSVNSSDTSLEDEEYRVTVESTNADIQKTSNTGEIRCTLSITGGTEVTAGSDIWEFGLFTDNGTLFYREVRNDAVTVESGDTKTFEFKITVTE